MELTKELKEYYQQFSQHGAGDTLIQLSPQEVALIICISFFDMHQRFPQSADKTITEIACIPYYDIVDAHLDKLPTLSIPNTLDYFAETNAFMVSEYSMYLRKLCDLHRKRFKYRTILKNQPFPTVEQIGPRSLLEYGNCPAELLFNWMSWRKWAYDIDNRSAQETAYLFEPILVSCLGGESVPHSKSPVKRVDAKGKQTTEGRQIDCYIKKEDQQYAYELKMRVTIAASGQGRFNEELIFPVEAKKAGIIPVLIVFDPTQSALLNKLKAAYIKNNGHVYIGDDAWRHLKTEAGSAMGKFIEMYIEPPIRKMEISHIDFPYPINLEATPNAIIISNGGNLKYEIKRNG